MTEFEIDPQRSALLVIDMQRGFCLPGYSMSESGVDVSPCEAVIPRVGQLVRACRDRGIQDFWTVQHHHSTDATRGKHQILHHTARLPVPPCLANTVDSEVVPQLVSLLPPDPDRIITKHRFGSFYDTRLETMLRMSDISMLVICGVITPLCVETTCREAYMRDYDVVVASDAVASYSQRMHEASLSVIGTFFGAVMPTESVIRHIRAGAAQRTEVGTPV